MALLLLKIKILAREDIEGIGKAKNGLGGLKLL